MQLLNFLNGFECWAVKDPQFWLDIRLAGEPERCIGCVETILDEDQGAPKPDDPLISPPCKRKADANDLQRDKVLAAVLSQTEIMVLRFTQSGGLSQRRGQALLDMLRHPNFDIKDVQSTNIVHPLWWLERPFKESTVTT